MDPFKRIDTSKLAPFFLERCQRLLEAQPSFVAISGYRDPSEQAALYAIGRTVDVDKPIVTKARPFKSYHNFGLAIDFCHNSNPNLGALKPDWDIVHYQPLADAAKALGLSPGYYWKSFPEGPHIQTPIILSTDKMKAIYEDKGIEAVWEAVHATLKASADYQSLYS